MLLIGLGFLFFVSKNVEMIYYEAGFDCSLHPSSICGFFR